MAYRDPAVAARTRVTEAKDNVDALEERITPALIEQLPTRLRASLEQSSAATADVLGQLEDDPSLELMGVAVTVLKRHVNRLEAAIERAPNLGRKFNRLPRAYPERTVPYFDYRFPDVYSEVLLDLRSQLHARIDGFDPKARLFDRRAGYFDHQLTPYLVEACFRSERAPLRLQMTSSLLELQRTTGHHLELRSSFCILMGMRPSTPELKLTPDAGLKQGFLSLLGLSRDAPIGDAHLDEAFVVDADPEDAERVLRRGAREALRSLMARAEVLVVENRSGLARVEWQEKQVIKTRRFAVPAGSISPTALATAVDLMVAIRKVPPTPLLRQLRRRRR